jgi:hypothetical protein
VLVVARCLKHNLELGDFCLRDQRERLAWPGYTVTGIIEELTAGAERVVEARLSGKALEQYRAGGYGTNNRSRCNVRRICHSPLPRQLWSFRAAERRAKCGSRTPSAARQFNYVRRH